MKFSTPGYFRLIVVTGLVLGAGLYLRLIRSERVERAETGSAVAEAKLANTEMNGGHDDAKSSVVEPTGPSQAASLVAARPVKQSRAFGLSGVVQLEDVPEGHFRDDLNRLSEGARRYALDKLGRLQVPLHDVASLGVDAAGQLFYQCALPKAPFAAPMFAADQSEAQSDLTGLPEITIAAAAVPIDTPPVRHSRPGATKIIYLDFNGHTISGTVWNTQLGVEGDAKYRPAVETYEAKAFNTDSDPTTFSDSEQTAIVQVWERVAEDFRGFDVDVTTEEPAVFTVYTGRILVTQNVDANGVNMPSSTAAGVAYLEVFGLYNYVSRYSPALVYANQVSNNEAGIAEIASHEMGHNLGLSHDGTLAVEGDNYYGGHGTGESSWNTIMGSASLRNKTQWSKGEYFDADNFQDDLAIIASRLPYIPDDHTDSNATATPLTVNGLAVSGSGIIAQTDDADRFSFESGAGAIAFSVTGFRSAVHSHGGNLDVALELYDTAGGVIASANVYGSTNATLNTTVTGGTYYLRVLGAGSDNPLNNPPSGYTNYGSLGVYTISGTIISTVPIAPVITSQPANQTVYAGLSVQFSVAASGYPSPVFQWQRLPAGSGVWVDLSNAGAYSGTTTTTLVVTNSATAMNGDKFRCAATNSVTTATSANATLTVNAITIPTFTTQPVGIAVAVGNSALFVSVASGAPAPTYQWKKNSVAIAGATGSSYSISSVAVGNAGSYTVVATNAAGSATSNVAVLSIIVAPTNAIISIAVQ